MQNETCADPESFVRGGQSFVVVVVVSGDEWIEDPNITINGSSSARQRNAF